MASAESVPFEDGTFDVGAFLRFREEVGDEADERRRRREEAAATTPVP